MGIGRECADYVRLYDSINFGGKLWLKQFRGPHYSVLGGQQMKAGIMRRRKVVVDEGGLIKTRSLFEKNDFGLLVEPEIEGVDLAFWSSGHQALVENWLLKHGALLFRGFQITDLVGFQVAATAIAGEMLPYKERSSPRHQVGKNNVYTSTDYPAPYDIFLHNENSYQSVWPLKVFFYCDLAPDQGGETPIADCRKIYQRLPSEIVEKFQRLGVCYVRNFGEEYGLSWQQVFGTNDKAIVEAHCAEKGMNLYWKEDGGLRTTTKRKVVCRHPKTLEKTWFNHATFFHISTREKAVQETLLAEHAIEDLPSNSFYGDGSAIEPDVLETLRAAYLAEKVAFTWEKGDILLIDNMLAAHGRAPYTGDRKILVAMAEPVDGSKT